MHTLMHCVGNCSAFMVTINHVGVLQSSQTLYIKDYIDKMIWRYRSPTTPRYNIMGQIVPTISCKSHPT